MSGVPGKGRGKGKGSGDKDDKKKRNPIEQHQNKLEVDQKYRDERKERNMKKKAEEKAEREAIYGPDPTPEQRVLLAQKKKIQGQRDKRATISGRVAAPVISLNDALRAAGEYAERVQPVPAPPHQARQPDQPAQDPFFHLDQQAVQLGAPLGPRRRRRRGSDGELKPLDPEPAPIAPRIARAREPPHIQAGNFQQVPQQQPAPMLSIPSASQAPARAQTWEAPPTQAGSSRQPPQPRLGMPSILNDSPSHLRVQTWETPLSQADRSRQPPQPRSGMRSILNDPLPPARARTLDTLHTQVSSFQQSPRQQPPTSVSQYPPAGQFTQQTRPTRAFQQPPPRPVQGFAEEYAPHRPQGYIPHQTSAYGSQQGFHYYDAQQPGYDARRAYPETQRPQRTASSSDPYAAVTRPLETLALDPRPYLEQQPLPYQQPSLGATTSGQPGRLRHTPPHDLADRATQRRNTGDTGGKRSGRRSNVNDLID